MTVILASSSAARRAMLDAADVRYEAIDPQVDEESAKAALIAEGQGAREIADALAELKALKLSWRHPAALVIGADQTLARDDGMLFDKARTMQDAAEQLRALSGRGHVLHSAAVIAEKGRPVWRSVQRATLKMRKLSPEFIGRYLDSEGNGILGSVGCYRIEGRGAQLFDRIDGDHFTILGMPLLPLLGYLRTRGVLPS